MSQQFDAIYDHGVLKPLVPLALPDSARVRITLTAAPQTAATPPTEPAPSAERPQDAVDFDAALDPLLFDGPNLPADFSRADIYADHD
jgi:hypothetical protein